MKRNSQGYIVKECRKLLDWEGADGAIVSDRITKDGWAVGYMYRDTPMSGKPDSGWRFLQGFEDREYMADAGNHHVFTLNVVCNYDPCILPYLKEPIGTCLIRKEDGTFMKDDGMSRIHAVKQNAE